MSALAAVARKSFDDIYCENWFSDRAFYVTNADADIGSLKYLHTLLDRCLKLYTTLWNIWTYQQLCKKITQLVYNFTQIV